MLVKLAPKVEGFVQNYCIKCKIIHNFLYHYIDFMLLILVMILIQIIGIDMRQAFT